MLLLSLKITPNKYPVGVEDLVTPVEGLGVLYRYFTCFHCIFPLGLTTLPSLDQKR